MFDFLFGLHFSLHLSFIFLFYFSNKTLLAAIIVFVALQHFVYRQHVFMYNGPVHVLGILS